MMASSYEVKQVAAKVKKVQNEIDHRRSMVFGDVKESIFWWKGAANESFINEYKKIDDEINALLDILAGLERRLKAVASAIDESNALTDEQS
jgi:WXG100 family type VII secretion target